MDWIRDAVCTGLFTLNYLVKYVCCLATRLFDYH